VWAETDMRAQYNPSRMQAIGELADKLAQRLATSCPKCAAPGWGRIKAEKGLNCEYCDQPTEMIAHEIYGCVLCDHTETLPRVDGLKLPHRCTAAGAILNHNIPNLTLKFWR
jgi:hypothetical protein